LHSSSAASGTFGLILAAGGGSRFGGPKLLAPVRGRPLVQFVIDAATEARSLGVLDGTAAVVAGGDALLQDLFRRQGIEVVENHSPTSGLANSLRLGLEALAAAGRERRVEAALVLLGDQPGVQASTIAALIATWRQGSSPLVRPRYARQPEAPGHPVLLARSAWALANEVEGDQGLGIILRTRPALVTVVDVPGANPDIDTAADLAALEETIDGA
jgi:CTP:molybdopterin cytidylyltransferase MocA